MDAKRWFQTSTLTRSSRTQTYFALIKVGRWLNHEQPDRADPAIVGSRELAAAWVARGRPDARRRVLARRRTPTYMRAGHGGQLSPRTKAHLIWSLRTVLQRHPGVGVDRAAVRRRAARSRCRARSRALIGPDPRVIADEVWAKLMWAGLNLTGDDLPLHANRGGTGTPWYPLELVRAVALLWLFAGLRIDEILRLRVGAIRWQHRHDRATAAERVCLLDVPTNKTATAFTKPVDPTRRRRDRGVGSSPARAPEVRRSQDRRAGRHAVRLPRRAARREVRQPGAGPAAVPQGRRPARGRPRRDHRASRAGDDRHPALQRQGPDVAVRAAGLARALIAAAPPSTTRGSPRSP